VYGVSDTAYGETRAKTFTPRLIRLSAVVISGVIMTILDTTIVNVAIHTLGRDFDVSVATIQWVATAYLLALALVIPLSGWAIERFGVRRLWFGSLVLFLVGSVLSGAAWSAESLIVFRVLQGAAGGIMMPVGQTISPVRPAPRAWAGS
jgi:MFS family permease